jgi:Fe-S cluster assembly iron-binding protein IscA
MIVNVEDMNESISRLTVEFEDSREQDSITVFHALLIKSGFELVCTTRIMELFDTGRTITFVKNLTGKQVAFADESAEMSTVCGGGIEGECLCYYD